MALIRRSRRPPDRRRRRLRPRPLRLRPPQTRQPRGAGRSSSASGRRRRCRAARETRPPTSARSAAIPIPVGVVGGDADGPARCASALRARGIDDGRLVEAPGYRTPTKTRILGGAPALHQAADRPLRRRGRAAAPTTACARALDRAAPRRGARRRRRGPLRLRLRRDLAASRRRACERRSRRARGSASTRATAFRSSRASTPRRRTRRSSRSARAAAHDSDERSTRRRAAPAAAARACSSPAARAAWRSSPTAAVAIPVHGTDQVADVTGAGDTCSRLRPGALGRSLAARGGAARQLRRRRRRDEDGHGRRDAAELRPPSKRTAPCCRDGLEDPPRPARRGRARAPPASIVSPTAPSTSSTSATFATSRRRAARATGWPWASTPTRRSGAPRDRPADPPEAERAEIVAALACVDAVASSTRTRRPP